MTLSLPNIKASCCALALALVALAGCAQRQQSPLEAMVEQAAAQCPVDMGASGRLLSVALDRSTNQVRYVIAIDEHTITLDQLRRNDYAKRSIAIMSQQADSKRALAQMAKEGAGFAVTYRSATSGELFTVSLTPDEVRHICEAPAQSAATVGLEYIRNMAEMDNSRCPHRLDEGITLTRVLVDGQWLTYMCVLDERLYDIAMLEATRQQTTDDIAATFANPEMRPLLQALIATGHGLRYRYLGGKTGNDVIIDFTPDDLKSRLDNLAQ